MRRVLIIGSGGAGKSTLAVRMGKALGLPIIHLDQLYWQPGWQETADDAWKKRIADLLGERDRWIMDGNYGSTLEERVLASDAVILLALPRLQCLCRVIKRSIHYRGRARPDLDPGCPEHFPDWSFIRWIWSYPRKQLPKVLALLRVHAERRQVVILRSSAEVRRFLAAIAPPVSAASEAVYEA